MNQDNGNYRVRKLVPDIPNVEEEQSVSPSEMRKRSVMIAGHHTSVSLENAFWNALKEIAKSRGVTVNQVVTEIDNRSSGNLSSAIRLFVLDTYRSHGLNRTV